MTSEDAIETIRERQAVWERRRQAMRRAGDHFDEADRKVSSEFENQVLLCIAALMEVLDEL